jgi:serine/threonine-protein kinase
VEESHGGFLPAGTIVDKYRIERALGQGGMGVVYVAQHTFLEKKFAIKLLRPEIASQPGMAERFAREARATSLIDHPNVVRVNDFGRAQAGELYLVMELLAGKPLTAELMAKQKLEPDAALALAGQILRGLEAAHAEGVVHRDLKPDNVFLATVPSGAQVVKLLDFGIAKLADYRPTHLTLAGSVLGTPRYMSPEQARGEKDVDSRADLYAVAVLLYRMLSGTSPFRSENYVALLGEIQRGEVTPLLVTAPELDAHLADIVMRGMALERSARYQSALEMREALPRIASESGPAARLAAAPARSRLTPVLLEVPAAPTAPTAVMTAMEATVLDPSNAPAQVPATRPPRGASPPPPPPPEQDFESPDAFDEKSTRLAARRSRTQPALAQPLPPPSPVSSSSPSARVQAALAPVSSSNGSGPRVPVDDASGKPGKASQPIQSESDEGYGQWLGGQLVGCLALLLAVVAAAVIIRRVERHHAPPPPPPPPAEREIAIVTLSGMPDKSTVYLDGVQTLLNPMWVPISPAQHEIRVECEGYTPRAFKFVADGNRTLSVALQRAADPGPDRHR